MPKEPSVPTSTTSTSESGDQTETTAAHQAQAMRARLGAQRDAEEILAEAARRRQAAAEEADTIVADAEALAARLVAEAREAAENSAIEAKERADGILARAYYEAEDLQRHTEEERARIRDEVTADSRAEIESFRTRSVGLLDQAEGGLRDALRSLEELRNGPDAPALVLERVAAPEPETEPETVPEGDQRVEEMVTEGAPVVRRDDVEARPLGWLFRASQP